MSVKIHFKLEEIALLCGVETDLILRFVCLAWIHPADVENGLFDEEDVARIRLIFDLQERLGVNDNAVPVILHLIDQLHGLHLANDKIT